jgi:hypothetical protein
MPEKSIDQLVREQRGVEPPRTVKRSEATIEDLDRSLRGDDVVVVPDDTDNDGSGD